MCALWNAVRSSLQESVQTHAAVEQFERMRQSQLALRRFDDSVSLIAYLTSRSGDLDEKDTIYAVLVQTVQANQGESAIATTLLWLGLWPALDVVFRRRQRFFGSSTADLVSEIGEWFTTRIHRTDVKKVRRIAVTLTRGADRGVQDGLSRGWAENARRAVLPNDDVLEGSARVVTSALGLPVGLWATDEVQLVREAIAPAIGGDVEIVIGAVIYGETHREIAERLGLTHEATRKRFTRAMRRLRTQLGGDVPFRCPNPSLSGEGRSA